MRKTMTNREVPLIVIEKFPDQWASIVRFAFSEPRGRVLIQLDRFGDRRSLCARPYAPLRTAKGVIPAGWLNPGDHIYFNRDIGESIDTAAWQITSIHVDWEEL